MKEIFNTVVTLRPEDSKTNISVDFQLDRNFAGLKISCSYQPKNIEDVELAEALINEALEKYVPSQHREKWGGWERYLPLTNLVTLSLDYEGSYLGCAHRHSNEQVHYISELFSSPGFIKSKAAKGRWQAVINVHSVSSPTVPYSISIFGLEKDDELPIDKEAIEFKTPISVKTFENVSTSDVVFKAFELHTHTLNSDGQFTVEELCKNAIAYEYDGIALTDHNTMAGWQGLTPLLAAATLPVIKGIEWTTYFGHMLVLGATEYVDWRQAVPDTIDQHIKKIREVGGVVGIAHPFTVGSPLCTGCNWAFNVSKWENVNYIEVWSKPYPMTHFENPMSFDFWTELLNKGYKIAATSGRDWHGPDKERVHTASTYLGIEGKLDSESAVDAIREGRTYVTAGPAMDIKLEIGSRTFIIGDTAPQGYGLLKVAIDEKARRGVWEGFNIKPKTIQLTLNGINQRTLKYEQVAHGGAVHFNEEFQKGWIRIEVYGDYLDREDTLLAFSSPIYIE